MSLDVVTIGIVCADVIAGPMSNLPAKGQLGVADHLDLRLGGLAGVTASVLAKLGATAAYHGKVGRDPFGDFVVNEMAGHGVDVSGVIRTDETTTSATVVLLDTDGERTFMCFRGASAAMSEEDIDSGFVERGKVLHWGGPSLTPLLDGAPIARVFARAQEKGMITSIDTVFDGGGVWFPHIEEALAHTNIMMSNREEGSHYTGRTAPDEMADWFLERGPETVLIKLGEDGLLAKNREGSCRLRAHEVPVVDTTGAGDAACGGFLYGHLQNWELRASAELANAVGALTVQSMGGATAEITLERALALAGESQLVR